MPHRADRHAARGPGPGAHAGNTAGHSAERRDSVVGRRPDASGALGDDLRRREFQVIIDTLRTERGRRKEAAERLGISPRTLRYKLAQMRDAGMDVEAYLYAI